MKVLGLDTSTASASVAVVEQGSILTEGSPAVPVRMGRHRPRGRASHSEALLPLIERVLGEQGLKFADLAALGVAIGPGSFTGLRIGLSTVKGLAYGSDLPVFGVRTLEAMARRVPAGVEERFVCPFMDARKGQVYAALYRSGTDGLRLMLADTLDTAENVLNRVAALTTSDCVFVGEGARLYSDLIEQRMGRRAQWTTGEGYPSTASAVARIAEEKVGRCAPDALHELAPDYLRAPDAALPKTRTV